VIVPFAKHYALALAAFVVIDGIWLTLAVPRFYQPRIGYLLKESPNLPAAAAFYLLFVVGLVVFVVMPSVGGEALGRAVLRGALFGLVCYAAYDLTNLATVRDWPPLVTFVDLAWGTALSATVTLVTVWLGRLWA
jgi:uncharacterized membrane protein